MKAIKNRKKLLELLNVCNNYIFNFSLLVN